MEQRNYDQQVMQSTRDTKRSYHSPRFKVIGSVVDLTRGGFTGQDDFPLGGSSFPNQQTS